METPGCHAKTMMSTKSSKLPLRWGMTYWRGVLSRSSRLLSSPGHHDRDVPPTECDLRHQRILSPPRVIFNKTRKGKHSHTKINLNVCPDQWVRTIRSLTQVRGLTHPSIPPAFHWCEEKCPETPSQESWNFFLSISSGNSCRSPLYHGCWSEKNPIAPFYHWIPETRNLRRFLVSGIQW